MQFFESKHKHYAVRASQFIAYCDFGCLSMVSCHVCAATHQVVVVIDSIAVMYHVTYVMVVSTMGICHMDCVNNELFINIANLGLATSSVILPVQTSPSATFSSATYHHHHHHHPFYFRHLAHKTYTVSGKKMPLYFRL